MSDMNFASLSPTLLARKGGAKPAMRRQSPIIAGSVAGAQPHRPDYPGTSQDDPLDDLGWNDLGEPDTAEGGAPGIGAEASEPARAPAPHANDVGEQEREDEAENEPGDERSFAPLALHAGSTANDVDEEQEEPARNVTPIRKGAPRLPRPRLVETPPAEPKAKRTAFTLRLDPERHLKLRMACTLESRSAQALVTDALDAMLAQMPELDQLVARVQSRPTREG